MASIHAAFDGLPRVIVRFRQKQGEAYAETENLTTAIDTGASETFVAIGTLLQAGFKPFFTGQLRTGSSATDSFIGFEAEMAVIIDGEDPEWIPTKVCEAALVPFPGCDGAIGHPFLRQCVFLYDGLHGRFTLTW
jgi:hypothetical protein